jgi:DNA-binding LytR/AlgR family response regulator
MRLLILEDEAPARDKLVAAIKAATPEAEIVAALPSIAEAGKWFTTNRMPDLIFADIQLADGLSLELLQSSEITCPVVFATAFDEYLLEAFAAHGIDYLLKPIRTERVAAALAKYEELREHFTPQRRDGIVAALQRQPGRRERFLVRRGIDLMSVPVADVAYLYASDRLVFLMTKAGVRHVLDRPLNNVEAELDPTRYFRANRAFIVSVDAIARCRPYGKGKLLLELRPAAEEEVVVSQERAAAFRAWLGE